MSKLTCISRTRTRDCPVSGQLKQRDPSECLCAFKIGHLGRQPGANQRISFDTTTIDTDKETRHGHFDVARILERGADCLYCPLPNWKQRETPLNTCVSLHSQRKHVWGRVYWGALPSLHCLWVMFTCSVSGINRVRTCQAAKIHTHPLLGSFRDNINIYLQKPLQAVLGQACPKSTHANPVFAEQSSKVYPQRNPALPDFWAKQSICVFHFIEPTNVSTREIREVRFLKSSEPHHTCANSHGKLAQGNKRYSILPRNTEQQCTGAKLTPCKCCTVGGFK